MGPDELSEGLRVELVGPYAKRLPPEWRRGPAGEVVTWDGSAVQVRFDDGAVEWWPADELAREAVAA